LLYFVTEIVFCAFSCAASQNGLTANWSRSSLSPLWHTPVLVVCAASHLIHADSIAIYSELLPMMTLSL
jgi:hypothetical protein